MDLQLHDHLAVNRLGYADPYRPGTRLRALVDDFGSARPIPAGVNFAILTHRFVKPFAFPSAVALAASIHRRRAGAPIHPFSQRVPIRGAPEGQRFVRLDTMDEGQRRTFLGYAWLGGGRDSQRILRAAMEELQPGSEGGWA